MALVPTTTEVHVMREDPGNDAFSFLLLAVHNVHCYPGVPSLLKKLFVSCKVGQLFPNCAESAQYV